MWIVRQAPRLVNVVIADNQAGWLGAGIYVVGASPQVVHASIARNSGGDGSGIHVIDGGYGHYSSVAVTNTIIASHTVGITVTAGNTATLETTLWHANAADWGGDGAFEHASDQTGDPAFSSGGYHLSFGSAALDKGVDAGVTTDIDGDDRPWGAGYDIGADELRPRYVYVPLVLKNR